MTYNIINADIREWAKKYDGPKFHAILSDPPYNLESITKRFGKKDSAPAKFGTDGVYGRHSGGFMGMVWDSSVAFDPELWHDIGQHLLPGAYLLAFGGTRTQHRLICAIEDAGFMIFDLIAWIHGQGFPKNHNISKQIDRSNGVERDVVGTSNRGSGAQPNKLNNHARGDTGIGTLMEVENPSI
jgi:site-specific DNA-methyltransferase (adenine-specific)